MKWIHHEREMFVYLDMQLWKDRHIVGVYWAGPCIGNIYPTLLGFGGIETIILSIKKEQLHWLLTTAPKINARPLCHLSLYLDLGAFSFFVPNFSWFYAIECFQLRIYDIKNFHLRSVSLHLNGFCPATFELVRFCNICILTYSISGTKNKPWKINLLCNY